MLLLLPFALIVTLYQFLNRTDCMPISKATTPVAETCTTFNLDTPLTVVYGFVVVIWGILVTERWKRKQSHITFTWGYTIDLDNKEDSANKKEVNNEYSGFYRFDWDYEKTVFSGSKIVRRGFKLMNYLTTIFFVTMNCTTYMAIKYYIDLKMDKTKGWNTGAKKY